MTQNFVHRKPCTEAEIYAALRVMEPPDWIALYSCRDDDDMEFIGCFHLGGHPSVMDVLRVTCQACERDGMRLVLIPTEDPKVVEILDCENGRPAGYQFDELDSLRREFEYAREMAREQMRLPRFSSRYLAYLKPVTPIFNYA